MVSGSCQLALAAVGTDLVVDRVPRALVLTRVAHEARLAATLRDVAHQPAAPLHRAWPVRLVDGALVVASRPLEAIVTGALCAVAHTVTHSMPAARLAILPQPRASETAVITDEAVHALVACGTHRSPGVGMQCALAMARADVVGEEARAFELAGLSFDAMLTHTLRRSRSGVQHTLPLASTHASHVLWTLVRARVALETNITLAGCRPTLLGGRMALAVAVAHHLPFHMWAFGFTTIPEVPGLAFALALTGTSTMAVAYVAFRVGGTRQKAVRAAVGGVACAFGGGDALLLLHVAHTMTRAHTTLDEPWALMVTPISQEAIFAGASSRAVRYHARTVLRAHEPERVAGAHELTCLATARGLAHTGSLSELVDLALPEATTDVTIMYGALSAAVLPEEPLIAPTLGPIAHFVHRAHTMVGTHLLRIAVGI